MNNSFYGFSQSGEFLPKYQLKVTPVSAYTSSAIYRHKHPLNYLECFVISFNDQRHKNKLPDIPPARHPAPSTQHPAHQAPYSPGAAEDPKHGQINNVLYVHWEVLRLSCVIFSE